MDFNKQRFLTGVGWGCVEFSTGYLGRSFGTIVSINSGTGEQDNSSTIICNICRLSFCGKPIEGRKTSSPNY